MLPAGHYLQWPPRESSPGALGLFCPAWQQAGGTAWSWIPQLVVAGSEAGLVVVIARPSRADGADVGRGGGAGVKIAAGALGGADVVWSVIVS